MNVDQQDNLIELIDTFDCLWDELNTLELMVLGLVQAKDPYAKGFGTICVCFRETLTEAQGFLEKISFAEA